MFGVAVGIGIVAQLNYKPRWRSQVYSIRAAVGNGNGVPLSNIPGRSQCNPILG